MGADNYHSAVSHLFKNKEMLLYNCFEKHESVGVVLFLERTDVLLCIRTKTSMTHGNLEFLCFYTVTMTQVGQDN